MYKISITMFLIFLSYLSLNAQNIVTGIVINADSEEPLQGVLVSIRDININTTTNQRGVFLLQDLPNGRQIVSVSFENYETLNFPVNLTGKTLDLGSVLMYTDLSEDQDLTLITITDDELNDDTSAADNISGLLQASRDIYSRTAAFEWSGSFYRIRGLDSENGKVLINGIEMNKLYNGRPQWSNWGGLNDVLRNQEFSNGLTPSNYTFGGVLGSTNISTRASEYSEGGRISYASSNRSYVHRLMVTYTSGLLENGWAIAASGSRRAGNEGYTNGTFYDANSIFLSIEKQINNKHSVNLTIIAAENERGKAAPHTQEVYDLKGIKYNEYWGYQNGKIRNSRVRKIYEPIVMLNHYWDISNNTTLTTNLSYQFGEIGNSRIDFNAGENPSPVYYQKLPSYWIDRDDLEQAYEFEQNFLNDGQLNWNTLYAANVNNASNNLNNAYVLYEDRNDDTQLTVNSIVSTEINDNITFNGKLQYSKYNSENFATVIDLLGGNGYLDINRFAKENTPARQNNLLTPNRVVKEGDKFRYNYKLESEIYGGFAQAQFKYNKVDFYFAGDLSKTSHQRKGLYQNGRFINNSLGKSEKQEFTNYGAKGGVTYKISGRHLLDFNGGYLTKAPTIRNTFSNPRENNAAVIGLTDEKIVATDASYIFRSPLIQAKATGYYTKIENATDIGFFFLQAASADNIFIQEVVTGINKKHFGAEIGIEAQVTSTIKLKGAANVGQYTFDNNPNLYIASEDFVEDGNSLGVRSLGKTNLKNYRLASGPQKAYSLGFEYRDPDYWWIGATANYLDDTFIDIGPITRTSTFYSDSDGLPFNNYNPEVARKLLQQEQFDSYFIINLVGGKSWKIGDYYVGLFASVNNLLDQEYKSGGFEQSRRGDYNSLLEESQREKRLFGSKYWYGRGTTYFLNVYFRF